MSERVYQLANDAIASVAIEGRVKRVDQSVMCLAAAFMGTSGLLVVRDVVGQDCATIVLRTRKDLIVADPGVAARVLGLADGDNVESALSQLERDRRRSHLVEQQPHAAGATVSACRSRSAASTSIWMRSSMSLG
jgi:hypothetical protein